MGDYGQDFNKGYHGNGWNSDTDMSAFYAGQSHRQREQEEAARRSGSGTNSWSTGTGGGSGDGAGIAILAGIVIIGSAIWAARYFLTGTAIAIAATGTMLWLVLPFLGARPAWWKALVLAVVAGLAAVIGAAIAVAVAYGVAMAGGPELIQGMHYVTLGMLTLLDLPNNMGPSGYIFPAIAALAAAVWALDRMLPAGRAHRGLRWIVLAAVLLVGPAVGLWYGLALWRGLAPLDFATIFTPDVPVTQGDAIRSALGAIAVGVAIVAGVSALAAKALAEYGWRIDRPGKVAVRTGIAYAVHGVVLVVLLILFRNADPFVQGIAEGLAPRGRGFGHATGGLGGLLLLELIPFALFAVIARKAVTEPRASRRFALGAAAMLLVFAASIVAIVAGWLLLFMSA